jgi:hypothetical protein
VEKRDKRLYIIITVIIVAVILLFLAKRAGIAGAGNSTVINNSGGITMPGGGIGFDIGDMPAVSYVGGDYNGGNQNFQKPCGLCFAGFTRNVLPAPVAPAPQVQEMIRYVSSQPVRLPAPAPSRTFTATATPAPSNTNWWDNCIAGRCF